MRKVEILVDALILALITLFVLFTADHQKCIEIPCPIPFYDWIRQATVLILILILLSVIIKFALIRKSK